MELYEYLSPFITGIFLFIGYLVVKSYWPKYFEKKGENQATKEDIGEITKIVEGIKTTLTKETELLKADLASISQHNLLLNNAKREALLDLNAKINTWFNSITHYQVIQITVNNFDRETFYNDKDLNLLRYQLLMSRSHLKIFYDNDDFYDILANLALILVDMQSNLAIAVNERIKLFAMLKDSLENDDSENQSDLQQTLNQELHDRAELYHSNLLKNVTAVNEYLHPLNKILRTEILSFYK